MSTLKSVFLGLSALLSLTTLPSQWAIAQALSETYRTWTDQHGRTLSACVKRIDENKVVLVDRRARERSVNRSALSPHDQQLIAEWSKRTSVVRFASQQVEGSMENRSVGGGGDDIARILNSPEVLSAIEKMKSESIRPVVREKTYKVTKYVREYYWKYFCKRGRLYRYKCWRDKPLSEERTRTYTAQVQQIQGASSFDDLSDITVGRSQRTYQIANLPKAAGARASKVQSLIFRLLPIQVQSSVSDLDRILVIESFDFLVDGAVPGKERKFRIVATVESGDNKVQLVTAVRQRDEATKTVETDSASLNSAASALADSLLAELNP